MAVLGASGFAAGIVNAVAGGGTLITFPALVAIGLPMVAANATNTVAIWPGTVASVYAYRGHLQEERARAVQLAVPSLIGGLVGSILLLALPDSTFEAVVPFLILFACALLAFQGPLKRALAGRAAAQHPAALWVTQLLVAIYGGYFGAGVGILMLAAMSVLLPSSAQHANALKVLLAMLINGIAALWFLGSGEVWYAEAGVMLVTSLAGGFVGARVAQRLPPAAMRWFAIVVGLVAAGKFLSRL